MKLAALNVELWILLSGAIVDYVITSSVGKLEFRVHELQRLFKCNYCQRAFKNKNEATRHALWGLTLHQECWFLRSMQSFDKAQSKKTSFFYFVEQNVSNVITKEIRNDKRSNMNKEDFYRVLYRLYKGFHLRSLISVNERWKCSLRLF